MTPVGHGAFGYVTGRGLARVGPIGVTAVVVGSVLPDIDFLVVWAPQFNAWHRVVTHNLLFCAVATVLAAWLGAHRHGRARAWAWGLGVALGSLGHLLVDSAMDTNGSNGIGVAWLWPWDPQAYSPFNLMALVPAATNPVGWHDLGAAARAVLWGLVWELPWWALAAVLWWSARRQRAATAPEPRPPPGSDAAPR